MVRAFAESATTWKGAFLRAATWSGPHLCGALAVDQTAAKPWRDGLVVGLLIGAVPAGLALLYRSWRVGVASALLASAVVAAAMAIVGVWARLG